VNIPYSALMATMTRDSMQRNWLAGARMVWAFLGTAVVSYFTPRLVTYFTSDGRTAGYFGATTVLAVLATVFTIVTFTATREDPSITHAEQQPPPLSELLRMLAKNVPS
jgi:Na+/melibiose symporter-like transporter